MTAHLPILLEKYKNKKQEIKARLAYFENVGKAGGSALFEELAFCILTPQSKAFSCDEAIKELKAKGLLFKGNATQIAKILAKKTRFHNNKAKYLVLARKKFENNDFSRLSGITFSASEKQARCAILSQVKGIGWKEASHYLRNVGRGKSIAILDRHILKNLKKYGAISSVSKTLTKKKYLWLEKKMQRFCEKTHIPLSHLDLLFWAEETGRIFK